MTRFRLLVFGGGAAALLGGSLGMAGLASWQASSPSPDGRPRIEAPARAVGVVSLRDQDGRLTTRADFVGQPSVVFFGYTHCPDICPTALLEIGQWLDALGSGADRLRVYFVSVDPARDTPERLKAYLSAFDPRIRGLTGTEEDVRAAALMLGAAYAKVATADGYAVDHSTTILLLDPQGRYVNGIYFNEDAATAVPKLETLLRT